MWSTRLIGRRVAPWVVAVVLAAGAVLAVAGQSVVRPLEAKLSSVIIGAAQISSARSIGSVVVFPMHGDFVGLALNAGCSAALLVAPFLLLGAGLVLSGRTSVQRGLATLGALVLSLVVVNQLRILVIALAMRLWGAERGFEISHVALGTVVSTLGVVLGLILYLRTALHSPVAVEHG